MASSMISSPAATTTVNRFSTAQGNMVAPFTGLKSMAGFPVRKTNNDITSIASHVEEYNACSMALCTVRTTGHQDIYYEGRYWTMWKLPMFGRIDPAQVLKEVDEAVKEYPNAFVRIIGFDNVRQVQCISFIAYKPSAF